MSQTKLDRLLELKNKYKYLEEFENSSEHFWVGFALAITDKNLSNSQALRELLDKLEKLDRNKKLKEMLGGN